MRSEDRPPKDGRWARLVRRPRGERATVERHLVEAGQRISRARNELQALDEQVAWFSDAAADARTRAVVADSAAERRELEEAERHLQAITRSRSDLAGQIERLRRLQEELLEELPELSAEQ